eukprot:3959569-Prymnesium_polylepis.1
MASRTPRAGSARRPLFSDEWCRPLAGGLFNGLYRRCSRYELVERLKRKADSLFVQLESGSRVGERPDPPEPRQTSRKRGACVQDTNSAFPVHDRTKMFLHACRRKKSRRTVVTSFDSTMRKTNRISKADSPARG